MVRFRQSKKGVSLDIRVTVCRVDKKNCFIDILSIQYSCWYWKFTPHVSIREDDLQNSWTIAAELLSHSGKTRDSSITSLHVYYINRIEILMIYVYNFECIKI